MSLKKIIFIILGLLLLVVGTGAFYIYRNVDQIAEDILRDSIIKQYNNNANTKYLIDLEEIDFNLYNGSADLRKIRIYPKDSLVTYKRTIDNKPIANISIEIEIEKITLENLDYLLAINERKIEVDRFEINNPRFEIYYHDGLKLEDTTAQDTVDLKGIFLTHYDTFRIKEVAIINAISTYSTISNSSDTFEVVHVNRLSYQINNVVAHEQSLNSNQLVEIESYELHSDHIKTKIHNSTEISIGKIDYHSESNLLELSNLDIIPVLNSKDFLKKLKARKAWIKVTVDNLKIQDLDINKWVDSNQVWIDKMELTKPKLEVQTDSRIPFPKNENKPMLGEMIISIPLSFYVKECDIKKAHIYLGMRGTETTELGVLTFDNMNVQAKNITNMKSLINENPIMAIRARTAVNKTGKVNAQIDIDLSSAQSKTSFNVQGTNLKLPSFNSVLGPILRVDVKSGIMKSLKISSTISKNGGVGKMDAHYENMKLQFKEKDIKQTPGFFLNVVSGLANGVVKNNNIPGTTNYHTGSLKFQKGPHDSFFKMLWLVTLNGLEDSILGSNVKDERVARKKEKKRKSKNK